MLTLLDSAISESKGVSRRALMHIGGLGAMGLGLPTWLAARDQARGSSTVKAPKRCIQLFLLGAPPQQESWDPKPDSPAEYRGNMQTIATELPGYRMGEMFPLTARRMKKIAVLRAVSTGDNAHSSSGYYMTTGVPHAPMQVENAKPGAPNDWPSLGAIVRRLSPPNRELPAAITIPEQAENDGNLTWPGQDAGFLGRSADPWLLNCDPNANRFEIPGLVVGKDSSTDRMSARQTLLDQVDRAVDSVSSASAVHRSRMRQAFDMICSPSAKKAFDIDSESPAVRDRYGRSKFGQSVLLARRFVEAGVPLIRVNWTRIPGALNNGTWDTHSKNAEAVKALGPIVDRAYSALLDDLEDRGLLDDTLVVWTGEFGRTPKINGNGGRDHWGPVFSVALAGCGVRGGAVHGSSDKIAAYPRDGKVTPPDLIATMLHCIGIAPDSEIVDAQGRPLPASRGEVLHRLF